MESPAFTRFAVLLALSVLLVACGDGQPAPDARPSQPLSSEELRAEARRLAADGRHDEARRAYALIIVKHDSDDLEARRALGFIDFHTDILGLEPGEWDDPIPEEIWNRRGFDFLDAVVRLNTPDNRWLIDEDEIRVARKAVAEMREHASRLMEEPSYRAYDRVRANIAADPHLKDLDYVALWEPPYVICYSSSEILSEYDLIGLRPEEREIQRAALAERREELTRVLKEKAAIFKGTYEEWMRRYAKAWNLKPLTNEYGGRPDFPIGVRAFEDGVPLCIWIYTDHEAYQEYHEVKTGYRLPPGVAGYFTPTTGWVFLFHDRPPTDERIFEINKQVHEAVHQLEYWFTRQRNNWREPVVGQNAISEGIAEYLGSVELKRNVRLKFLGLNPMRLMNMQQFEEQLKRRDREYPLFPIEALISFQSYQEAVEWADESWGLGNAAMMLLYQQSWAFTYFLNEYTDGKYQEKWLNLFDVVLDRQTRHGMARSAFARIFRLRNEEDWKNLNEEWRDYVYEDLMKRDVRNVVPGWR